MMNLFILAMIIYIVYNISILKLFGVPHSLSMTYYLLGSTNKPITKHLFTLLMFSMAVLLGPIWMEVTPEQDQYSVFLSLCGILFVGAIPEFLKSADEQWFHTISALISALFATIWVVCIMNLWWVALIWFIIFGLAMYYTNTFETSVTYWLENVAFASVFTSIFILI